MYFEMTAINQSQLCTIKLSCVSNGDAPDGVTSVRIRRKKTGTVKYVTLKEIPIASANDFTFDFVDNTARSGCSYDYHAIPVKNGVQQVAVVATVLSGFSGIYLSDTTSEWVCDLNPKYSFTINTSVGYVQPLMGRYPKRVSNGQMRHYTGEVSGIFLPKDSNGCYSNIEEILKEAFAYKTSFAEFLCNGKTKLLKDGEGHVVRVGIDSNIQEMFSIFPGASEIKFTFREIESPPEE